MSVDFIVYVLLNKPETENIGPGQDVSTNSGTVFIQTNHPAPSQLPAMVWDLPWARSAAKRHFLENKRTWLHGTSHISQNPVPDSG